MTTLTYAFCTFNRCTRLPQLVASLRAQQCPCDFELLAINNRSTDATLEVLEQLRLQPGAPLRIVTEEKQGIAHARNRALEEALHSQYLVFIDDDELPQPNLLNAAMHAMVEEDAECVGGRVTVAFGAGQRPQWLTDELLPFLAETDYGTETFWVTDRAQPMWTANIGYRMSLFRDDPTLRFDIRYNRVGHSIGGGEDVRMFEALMDRRVRIRYRPDMAVLHYVDPKRLVRSYFWRIHYAAGQKRGRFAMSEYDHHRLGLPLFLVRQALAQSYRSLRAWLGGDPNFVRTSMNFTYALGVLHGRWLARQDRRQPSA